MQNEMAQEAIHASADPMRRIGVTGGVGCGKSEVLRYLEERYGAVVLRSDDCARELMEPGGSCYASIRSLLGADFLQKDGSFDRAKIAACAFTDPTLLQKMNAILHPAVLEEIRLQQRIREQQGTHLFVVESALLLSYKDSETFSELWYVYAEEKSRRKRLRKSRGYSEEKITAMMANQPTEEEFRQGCDAIINNNGSRKETWQQIDALLLE